MRIQIQIIIVLILLTIFYSCISTQENKNIYEKCNEYIFIDSSSIYEYEILKFKRDSKTYYVLTNKELNGLNKSKSDILRIGSCYKLTLKKNDTLTFLNSDNKINVRTAYPIYTYWDIKDTSSAFLRNDTLIVDTYTSESLSGIYYIKK